MTIEQRLERVGQVADRIDVAHLAVGDEACEQCPVFRADLVTARNIGNTHARHQAFRRDPRPFPLAPKPPAIPILEYLDLAGEAVS